MSGETTGEPAGGLGAGSSWRAWFARAAVGAVFVVNIWCALAFILDPDAYVGGFELVGVPGRIAVQSFGILFLMWNATYPPVVLRPALHKTLFGVVLAQQTIGLVGEVWLWLTLPAGHEALSETGRRFIIFDAVGLVLMSIAYIMLHGAIRSSERE